MTHPNPLLASGNKNWITPDSVIRAVEKRYGVYFTLDAAASPENTKAPDYITEEDNALVVPWRAPDAWVQESGEHCPCRGLCHRHRDVVESTPTPYVTATAEHRTACPKCRPQPGAVWLNPPYGKTIWEEVESGQVYGVDVKATKAHPEGTPVMKRTGKILNYALDFWMAKVWQERTEGKQTIAVLTGARTETDWWWTWALKAHHIDFIRGRINFDLPEGVEEQKGSTFPSALIMFRDHARTRDEPNVGWWELRKVKSKGGNLQLPMSALEVVA